MPRYDDRQSGTRLYVGHLSSRTRSRDLEDVFGRYGRVRDVDMKRDFAFVDFSDSRDADDARHSLNGRDVDGSRLIVEFAKGAQRGPGGSRDYLGKGPTPGSGRCFNCGIDGHWARDCKDGDWKNKCYRCGDRGHIEKIVRIVPRKHGRSYSRSPPPRRGRSISPSNSRSRSYSRSRSPPKRERRTERSERRSRSPRRRRDSTPPPSRGRNNRSLSPDNKVSTTPSPKRSKSPNDDPREISEENGPNLSPKENMASPLESPKDSE